MRYNNRTDVTEKEKKLRCILGHPSLQCFILSLSRTSSYPRTSLDMDVTLQEIVFFKIHIRGKSGGPNYTPKVDGIDHIMVSSKLLSLSRTSSYPRTS